MHDLIEDNRQPPPPCFFNRAAWKEYLKSAADSRAKRIFVDGRINPNFNFCQGCPKEFSEGKKKQSLCKPNFYKEVAFEQD
jgi:hypothetical protein